MVPVSYTHLNVDVTNTTDNNVITGTTKTTTNASTGYYLVTYDGYDITNTLVKDVTVTKTWIDGNDEDRPAITVELLQNGQSFDPAKTDTIANNATTYTWVGVPVYDGVNNKNFEYTVKEIKIGDTNVTYKGNSLTAIAGGYEVVNSGLTITNTKLTSVEVEKQWKNADNSWPEGATDVYKRQFRRQCQHRCVSGIFTAGRHCAGHGLKPRRPLEPWQSS